MPRGFVGSNSLCPKCFCFGDVFLSGNLERKERYAVVALILAGLAY